MEEMEQQLQEYLCTPPEICLPLIPSHPDCEGLLKFLQTCARAPTRDGATYPYVRVRMVHVPYITRIRWWRLFRLAPFQIWSAPREEPQGGSAPRDDPLVGSAPQGGSGPRELRDVRELLSPECREIIIADTRYANSKRSPEEDIQQFLDGPPKSD